MLIRHNILPSTLGDAAVTCFFVCIIPTVYWFEIFVVLPKFYDLWSFWYNFHFISGLFIFINVTSNFAAVVLCDTSIKGRILPTELKENGRFCSSCECVVPPRSWHCNTCKICILKRDHHCMFTSCCIGHSNQRYFLMLIFYLTVATLYASYYNVFFIISLVKLNGWISLLQLMFPLAMIFYDPSRQQVFLFLTLIIAFGCLFTATLLYHHTRMVVIGSVTYEANKGIKDYNYGLMENMKISLGERWYLVWLSPFISSEVNHDGIIWECNKKKL